MKGKGINLSGIFLILALAVGFVVPKPAMADLAPITSSWGQDDVDEINRATPGTTTTFLGTRLRGLMTAGSDSKTSGTYAAANASSETITETHVNITTVSGYGSSTTLANGQVNQVITFTLTTDGGKDWKLSPDTKTGFTDITLDDAGDSVSVKYVNSTIGWILDGGNGYNIDDDFGSTTIDVNSYAADNDTSGETITEAAAVVTTGADYGSSTTLNDGYINQELTFVLETDGGQDHQISPKTKAGFSSITLDAANDSVTLKYISDTLGWILKGNSAATIN